MPNRAADIAQNAELVTRAAGAGGVVAWFWELFHTVFGWATSGQFLATASVLVAITSGLIGVYYRRKEDARQTELLALRIRKEEAAEARHRENARREEELHQAKLHALYQGGVAMQVAAAVQSPAPAPVKEDSGFGGLPGDGGG